MKSLSFGEILWDVFDDYRHIGGAAFNFAAHLAKLGAQSSLVSAVGADSAGQEARGILQAQGGKRQLPGYRGKCRNRNCQRGT